jgi:predicted flap endonuclease-1-like 5' DNA nuclease
MNKQFEAVLEGQKKAMNFWADMSDQMTKTFKVNGKDKKPKDSLEFVTDWYQKQQQLWQEAANMGDPQKAFEQAPELFRKWAELNQSFSEEWLEYYKHNAGKMGLDMPQAPDIFSANYLQDGLKQWNKWVEDNAFNWRDQLMPKLPFNMQPHFSSFLKSFDGIHQYWEPISRMIQNGLVDKSIVDRYFAPDAYQQVVNQMFGFKAIGNVSDLIDNVNEWFEKAAVHTNTEWKDFTSVSESWQKKMNAYSQEKVPFYQMANDFNQQLRDQILPFYNVAAQGRETEIAKYQRDIQFAYVSFILKTAELQSKVYEAGQFAMPDTIRAYSEEYKQTKELPEYEAFFKRYINVLEDAVLETLHSDDYSTLQSEVAATGTNIRLMSEKLMELMMSDLPFLTKTDGDDIAKENASLRRKVRNLEHRLAALEEALSASASAVAPTVASTDPKKKLFNVIGTAAASEKDDLKAIKGIGPKLEGLLNDLGIYTFRQISKMKTAEYELIDSLLNAFQGRAKRDAWAKQAKELL